MCYLIHFVSVVFSFFFNDTASTEIYTLSLHDALPISSCANGPLEKWGTQTMAWADDDMAIVAEMAAEAGVALPQAGVNREICRVLKPIRYQLERYGR